MSFYKKTIKDIEVENKTILIRTDYNISLDNNDQIISDFRIKKSLPTIQYLLDKNCKIIICSHLGRPEGKVNPKYSLKPVALQLAKMLNKKIHMSNDCIGEKVKQRIKDLQNGEILVLENLRFHKEEKENNIDFAKKLAALAEIFVQDGFGVVHRAHASTEAITHYLPSVAGLLLAEEVDVITSAMENPKRPLAAIVGGAKISDKIDILNRFVDIADFVAVGGAMANTFLLAQNIKIGKSLAEKSETHFAKEILEKANEKAEKTKFVFYLPQDGVVSTSIDGKAPTRIVDWDANVISAIESYPKKPSSISGEVKEEERILDTGPFSSAFIAGGVQMASTVIWNGTLGVTETPPITGSSGPFAHGTDTVIDAMLGQFGNKPFTIVGGGDTASYIEKRKLTDYFNHVSTGGGASMELMSGKKLPGIEALMNKDGR